MGQQSIRQAARRTVMDAQSARRRERVKREQRLQALVIEVLVAVQERDAAVATAEVRAGEALEQMVTTEGLTVREVVQWCGEKLLTSREVARLRRVGTAESATGATGVTDTLSRAASQAAGECSSPRRSQTAQ